jgi:hypothetical protein
MNNPLLILLLYLGGIKRGSLYPPQIKQNALFGGDTLFGEDKAGLALPPQIKQKYQKWIIHRELRFPTYERSVLWIAMDIF